MPFVRLILPLGLVVFGAVAAFMGLVVVATALGSGEISIGSGGTGDGGRITTVTTRRDSDPAGYWRRTTAFGFAPAVLGLACAVFGWRRLGR